MSEPPRHLDRTRPRRLRIFSIVGIYAELDRIEAAATAGMRWEVGQWHAGNVLQQLARTIEYAIDGTPGYEYRPPWEFIADPRMRRNEMAYEAMSRLFWRVARSSHVQWGLRSDWSVLERVAKTRLERAPDRIAI